MASARELLDKADALMRRNRGDAASSTDTDIPVLTEAVPDASAEDADLPMLMDAVSPVEADVQQAAAAPEDGQRQAAAGVAKDAIRSDETVPETGTPEATAKGAGATAVARPSPQEPSSQWPGPDTLDPLPYTAAGSRSDPVPAAPAMSSRAVGSQPTPPPRGSQPTPGGSEPPPPASQPTARASELPASRSHDAQAAEAAFVQSGGEASTEDDDLPSASAADPALDDELKWQALAEQISMQVLQRIDLFTDSGLKQQLAAHLQPIVDRASAELVATINDHVGRLLRTYVAEAIEREIAQWRDENR
jgi:hypothetical protein